MDITLADLVKYGFAEDPNVFLQSERAKIDADFDQRMSQWRSNLDAAKQQGASDRIFASFDRQYEQMMTRKQSAYDSMERRFDTLTSRVESQLESPVFQRKVMTEKTRELEQQRAEQSRQAAAETEQRRQEAEGMQREEAERQAGRFRARGSRAAVRPMLSAARMAPQQPMAPDQTLGAFMSK